MASSSSCRAWREPRSTPSLPHRARPKVAERRSLQRPAKPKAEERKSLPPVDPSPKTRLRSPPRSDLGSWNRRLGGGDRLLSNSVLVLDQPHQPACHDRPAHEQRKTERSESHHHSRLCALRDAEHDGSEEREQQHRSEVRDGHERFLPLASEWKRS